MLIFFQTCIEDRVVRLAENQVTEIKAACPVANCGKAQKTAMTMQCNEEHIYKRPFPIVKKLRKIIHLNLK
jgi:hypothetical protein